MTAGIEKACASGASLENACKVAGISPRTIQRYRKTAEIPTDGREAAAGRRTPANKLTEAERCQILEVANSHRFASKPPSQIVPALADEGVYLASESSFYRALREENQLVHRGRARAQFRKKPKELTATGPNQLWSWDITYLPRTIKGLFFYLYLFMDIYSRKIVGWEVFDEESAEYAATTLNKAYLRERVSGKSIILHSDNGSPMKGATMLGTLQKLGVMPSLSRPSVSNDNAYSESLFKTLKYTPSYPEKPFSSILEARQWVFDFEHWYNGEHKHSGIRFVSPGQRHRGEDVSILEQREAVYMAAKERHPERWAKECRNWNHVPSVTLNPDSSTSKADCSRANVTVPTFADNGAYNRIKG